MPDKCLHIVCLDVPYPADYGGVYDLFYKLPALKAAGVKVLLHCFEYGRGEQAELKKYCEEVRYYRRQGWWKSLLTGLPYIVGSRRNKELEANLLKDEFPILMEGVHCTYPLTDKRFRGRRMFVRLHNVEHVYYHHLFCWETNVLKRLYFLWESWLLKKYERRIAEKDAGFWTVSEKDAVFYRDSFGCRRVSYLPLFLPAWKVAEGMGMGTYCLYHANLKVSENEEAARWLVKNVFKSEKIVFVIAGKGPSKRLQKLVERRSNISLVADPEEEKMQELIAMAHVNILPSFSETGIKLKLVNALFNGKYCLVNDAMVAGTGLESLCCISNNAADMERALEELYKKPFGVEDVELRKRVLNSRFNNEANAKQIVKWVWEE